VREKERERESERVGEDIIGGVLTWNKWRSGEARSPRRNLAVRRGKNQGHRLVRAGQNVKVNR
jgi:hypothetical protein